MLIMLYPTWSYLDRRTTPSYFVDETMNVMTNICCRSFPTVNNGILPHLNASDNNLAGCTSQVRDFVQETLEDVEKRMWKTVLLTN